MNLKLITAPPVQPVTLEEVYDFLRLDTEGSPPAHPQDSMLERHIKAATGDCERITGRAFVQQSWRLYVDRFPSTYSVWSNNRWVSGYGAGYIELLKPPLISIDQVQYYSDTNELTDVDTAEYYVSDGTFSKFYLIDTFSYPTLYRRDDAVVIDYTAGYLPDGSPPDDYRANIPEEIKHAILLSVKLLYDPLEPREREATESARDSLLSAFVVHAFS